MPIKAKNYPHMNKLENEKEKESIKNN